MINKLSKLERRLLEIESLLTQPSVLSDSKTFKKLSKESADLRPLVESYKDYKHADKQLAEARDLLKQSQEEDMKALAQEEIDALTTRLDALKKDLSIMLLPKDPYDDKNTFLEIRAGAGGDEASLFAGDLLRMYSRYSESRGWAFSIMSLSENELGGIKEVVVLIEGKDVYSTLKYESGVHRVQRVPQTESQGRVHTSTVTVAVLPEMDDIEVTINESDLRIDTYRASGAGGQHVNRTDSAVRITHLPTNIVVACQDERSQLKNKARAMKVLKAKLFEQAEMEQNKNLSLERKSQVGRGDRSERIRTYNFPQSRVTDHRINYSSHDLEKFLEGDIQGVLTVLKEHEQAKLIQTQDFDI